MDFLIEIYNFDLLINNFDLLIDSFDLLIDFDQSFNQNYIKIDQIYSKRDWNCDGWLGIGFVL